MSFQTKNIDTFLTLFESKKKLIRNIKGCSLLELYQDKNNQEIFFTYSYWNTEKDIENYRNSTLFKEVWTKTKVLFNEKPLAWSLDKKISLQ